MSQKLCHAIVLVVVLNLTGGAWANLVGHWKLDEGSGTVARDSSGNGYDGALQGGPQWVAGKVGGALKFTGNNSVNCGSAAKAALTQTVSITLWVNPADLAGDRAFVSRSAGGIGYAFKSYATNLRFTTPTVRDHDGANSILKLNTWQHVAVTFAAGKTGGCVFYINGIATNTLDSSAIPAGAANVEIGHNHWEQWAMGMIDDVRIYDHVLTQKEVQDAMKGQGPELAINPVPSDKATDVPADSTLAWTAGKFAATHDVYLGTVFADVNTASRTAAGSVLASQGQADAQYAPKSALKFGQTYYWRIDEVNKAPDNTIFKGSVWSFTVEPYGYPVKPVKATASNYQIGMGPEKTIDGSGLTGDLHGTEPTTMWMSMGAMPNWIQYEFDRVYPLNDLRVWNSNQLIEGFLGFGAKSVKIEYSTDGATWTALAQAPEFAKGPGLPAYAANTTVNFGGVEAKFVKLTISANWGGLAPQTGLGEVQFSYIPVQAFGPQPAPAATGVNVDTALNWRPGRRAASHQVYFGTDPNAVAKGTVTPQTATGRSYTPEPLNLGTTYYWKVDEVNAVTYPGEVWSFTTAAFKVVDDFESYTDQAGQEVFSTWVDGFGDPKANGALVGLDVAANGTFCETTIIHGGKQAMPLRYDNSAGAPASEAVWTFDEPQNWTTNGIKSLSLSFRGVAGNTGQLYLKIDKVKVAYKGAANDIAQTAWLPWNIDLSATGANLNKVTSLTIGIEGAGVKGTLYVDDVRLYPKLPEFVTPVQPAATGLVARYALDGDFRDSAGSHHGTAAGARIVSDTARGQVALFNGSSDKVDVPYGADLNPASFTVSVWANPTGVGTLHRSPVTSRDDAPQRGYILYIEPTGSTWQFWTGTGTGWNATTGPRAGISEWTHVAATLVNDQKALYVNGRLVGQSTAVLSPNTARPLRLGAGGSESATGNYFFNGLIDEVRLYNRVLSAEEVAGLAGHKDPLQKAF